MFVDNTVVINFISGFEKYLIIRKKKKNNKSLF